MASLAGVDATARGGRAGCGTHVLMQWARDRREKIRPVCEELFVARHLVRPVASECFEEVLANSGAEVDDARPDASRAGRAGCAHDRLELLAPVALSKVSLDSVSLVL